MNKILIIGDFSKNDNYSFWAEHQARILSRKFDIAIRCVNKTKSINSLENCKIALHILSPYDYNYINGLINICWPKNDQDYNHPMTKIMDHIISGSDNIKLSGIDTSQFPDPKQILLQNLDGHFVFYTINSNFERSSSIELIKSFNEEFHFNEPVSLVIKTNKHVDNEITNIKNNLNIYGKLENYKKETIITGNIPIEDLWNMHNNFDCFIATSKLETQHTEMAMCVGKYSKESSQINGETLRFLYNEFRSNKKPVPHKLSLDNHFYFFEKVLEQ